MANNYGMERVERLYNPCWVILPLPPNPLLFLLWPVRPRIDATQTLGLRNKNCRSLSFFLCPAGPPWLNTASTTLENWWDTRWTYRWSTTAPYVDWTPEFHPTFTWVMNFPQCLTWESPPPCLFLLRTSCSESDCSRKRTCVSPCNTSDRSQ